MTSPARYPAIDPQKKGVQDEDLGWIDKLEYALLRRFVRHEPMMDAAPYENASKLAILLGEAFVGSLKDQVVVDFGCGEGREALEIVQAGAKQVIGVDAREGVLETARRRAEEAGVADRCRFTTDPAGIEADVIVSLDSFEHFDDPATVLDLMYGMLRPGGRLLTSFGPTWYHPLGGHLFSVFPWAHLVLTEKALLRWRTDIRDDGATRFHEVEGGLNQMTIARFEECIEQSKFDVLTLQPVPIRKLRWMHTNATREFTSAVVRAELLKPRAAKAPRVTMASSLSAAS